MSAAKTGGSWVLKGRIANKDSALTAIPKWITMPNRKAYYDSLSGNGIAPFTNFTVFIDSVRAYAYIQDSINVDLTTGLKKLAVIYAGNIWWEGNLPHRTCLHSQANSSYGVFINSELFGSPDRTESSSFKFQHIGVNCHEFSHVIGGFSDCRDSTPFHVNLWELMGGGASNYNYLSQKTGDCPAPLGPIHRNMLGWMSFQNVTPKLENEAITYSSTYSNTDVYKIIGKTSPSNEFF